VSLVEKAMAPAPSQPQPFSWKRTIYIFLFVMAIFVLFDNTLRLALGTIIGYAFDPVIGFGGHYPVITLFLAGTIMTALTIVVRHFFSIDYVDQAKSQKVVQAFNKELRQARLENNTFKMKKLMEQQQKVMKKSLDMSTSQLKLMPVTLLIVVPIFAWVAVFMAGLPNSMVSLPWSMSVDLNGSTVLPNWILLYSLVSIPFGQILTRALRYYDFKRRLNMLTSGAV
jgi:uncharacterized membrane protein (DUF106 family)